MVSRTRLQGNINSPLALLFHQARLISHVELENLSSKDSRKKDKVHSVKLRKRMSFISLHCFDLWEACVQKSNTVLWMTPLYAYAFLDELTVAIRGGYVLNPVPT
jgi:hypothetical protein